MCEEVFFDFFKKISQKTLPVQKIVVPLQSKIIKGFLF